MVARTSAEPLGCTMLKANLFFIETVYYGVYISTVTTMREDAEEYIRNQSDRSYNKLRRKCIQDYKTRANDAKLEMWKGLINQVLRNGIATSTDVKRKAQRATRHA